MAFALPLLAAIPAGVGTAMSVAGAVIGAVGTLQAGNAASASASYNAQVADRDVAVADQNRKSVLEQTRIAADDKRRDNRRVLSSIRAQYGASGLSMAGSPLDVLQDTAVEQELDVRRTEYEGRVRGREGALQMLGLQEEGVLSRMEAKNARRAGRVGAVGSLASGVGSTLSRVA